MLYGDILIKIISLVARDCYKITQTLGLFAKMVIFALFRIRLLLIRVC